jgi:phosphatidate cytidylyltransferase
MLKTRILVGLVLLPIGIAAILTGGIPYVALIALMLALAAWEFVTLFRTGGLAPAGFLVVSGVVGLVFLRAYSSFADAHWLLTALVLAALTYHLVAYERGCDHGGTDFAVTLAGIFYLGWIGAYLVSLRQLPDGQWWLLLVLVSVWMADSGAYLIGSRYGRRKLSPRLSPKKTWEGYLGGVAAGTLAGAFFAYLWQYIVGPSAPVSPVPGAILGFVISSTTVLGDLGESLFKRQFGVKDSGKILPGHGGMFDRMDSWLWGGVLGYYIVLFLLAAF